MNPPHHLHPPPPLQPRWSSYHNLLRLIICLSIQSVDSRGRSYYLFWVTTQMVNQTARLMGAGGGGVYMCCLLQGEVDNDTTAQVVQCTPVYCAPSGLMKQPWLGALPTPTPSPLHWGLRAEDDMFCLSLTSRPHPVLPPSPPSLPPILLMTPLATSGLGMISQGLSPWQQAMSAHRKDQICFLWCRASRETK